MSKNVILILTDQLRGDCIGINSKNKVMTPFIDELAYDGINFTNAHSANPSCIPARASILTGLPAYKNNFFGYHDGQEWEYKDTLVDKLNNLGYETINVGKTHFYPQRNNMNFKVNKLYDPQNLDEGFKSDYHLWLESQKVNIEDTALIYDNNAWVSYQWSGDSYYHPTEWTLRESIKQIEEKKDKPFFLQMSFHRPHPPFDPPKFYLDMYKDTEIDLEIVGDWSKKNKEIKTRVHGQYGKIDDKYLKLAKKSYYGLITHIDYQVGRLIEYLKSNNLYDDTLIIFTSDHGEMLGDHYMFRKATPFRGSIHIPFIVKDSVYNNKSRKKDFKSKNIDPSKLITHIDILPTIMNFILEDSQEYDGINVLDVSSRRILHGEHPFDKGWHFLLTDEYKYIWDSISGQEWCFNIKNDINETKNIIDRIDGKKLNSLRNEMILSFENRGLTQFFDENGLVIGNILSAYKKEN